MDTTLIEYFITVARLQHISKAAEELNISQPALSSSINRLENELGVRLFDRKGRNIVLNELGRQYYQDVMPVLTQLDLANSRVRQASLAITNRLTIVAPPMFTFPDLMGCLQRSCPGIAISYLSYSYAELHGSLISGDLDLCILGRPIYEEGLRCTILHRDRMVMLVPEDHPLAGAQTAPLIAFQNDSFADYPNVASIQSERDMICRKANFNAIVTFEANTMHDIIEAVRSGNHVAMLPRKVLERYNLSRTAVVALEDDHCISCLRMYTAQNATKPIVEKAQEAIVGYFSVI